MVRFEQLEAGGLDAVGFARALLELVDLSMRSAVYLQEMKEAGVSVPSTFRRFDLKVLQEAIDLFFEEWVECCVLGGPKEVGVEILELEVALAIFRESRMRVVFEGGEVGKNAHLRLKRSQERLVNIWSMVYV